MNQDEAIAWAVWYGGVLSGLDVLSAEDERLREMLEEGADDIDKRLFSLWKRGQLKDTPALIVRYIERLEAVKLAAELDDAISDAAWREVVNG